MTSQIVGPRKQRTRQHVIADLSVHYLEGFILDEGHTAQRLTSDYSYDLLMRTFDEQGYVEPGFVYFQVKAAESLRVVGSNYVFDVHVRDYNLWIREEMPVVLVLFDASRKKAFWLVVQSYFRNLTRRPRRGQKTVRVRVPKQQTIDREAIEKLRDLKQQLRRPQLGVQP